MTRAERVGALRRLLDGGLLVPDGVIGTMTPSHDPSAAGDRGARYSDWPGAAGPLAGRQAPAPLAVP